MMMNNEYKYWIYYLKEDINEIYAYTDDKELSKKFEDFRDMNVFVKKKIKLSRTELNELARNEQGKYLENYKMKVYDVYRNTSFIMDIAITTNEKITLSTTIFQIETGVILAKDAWVDYRIFNKEIKKALKYIGYVDIYKYIHSNFKCDNISGIFIADELGIFIKHFGKTLKGEYNN